MLGPQKVRLPPTISPQPTSSPLPSRSLTQEHLKNDNHRCKTQTGSTLPHCHTSAHRHSLRKPKESLLSKGTSPKRQGLSQKEVVDRKAVKLPRASLGKVAQRQQEPKDAHRKSNFRSPIFHFEEHIVNLARVCKALIRYASDGEVTTSIKRYIEDQSQMVSKLEGSLADAKGDMLKEVLFYERVMMVMIVESMLVHRKLCAVIYTQLIKEITGFYSYLYEEWTGSSLQQFLIKRGKGYVIGSASYNCATIHATMVIKRMNSLLKQHPEVQCFVKDQLKEIKTHNGCSLYSQLLEFYAAKLASGLWADKGIQFLETCPAPYLKEQAKKKYTLLLDLDETLSHFRVTSQRKGQFLLRPYLFEFISRMVQHFEVGIFTCALKEYADIVIEHLEGISIRLYRQHALKVDGELLKDLSRVGRDLSRVILVDNLSSNFRLQPQNGIHIRSWQGDEGDSILCDVAAELQSVMREQPADIRKSKHQRSFL